MLAGRVYWNVLGPFAETCGIQSPHCHIMFREDADKVTTRSKWVCGLLGTPHGMLIVPSMHNHKHH